jgi:hypothetical protein
MSQTLPSQWQRFVSFLVLAARLEDEGQYNIAKLMRAGADAMARREAYEVEKPTSAQNVIAAIVQAADALLAFQSVDDLALALKRCAAAMAEGRVPLIDEAPPPCVCRTCGHLTFGEPAANCPTCGAWPGTFQRFMPNYWFDALEPMAAIERLRQTPQDVDKLLVGLPEAILNKAPPEGGWAIQNVVTHLRDAQSVFDYRIDLFRHEEHPNLEMKTVWAWATQEEERPRQRWRFSRLTRLHAQQRWSSWKKCRWLTGGTQAGTRSSAW